LAGGSGVITRRAVAAKVGPSSRWGAAFGADPPAQDDGCVLRDARRWRAPQNALELGGEMTFVALAHLLPLVRGRIEERLVAH
jgi:hypothetical protein